MTQNTTRQPGFVAAMWWRALQPRPDGSGGDRAALARLRHAATASEAAMEPATLDLCRRLGFGPVRLGGVAVAAAVLAHIRDDDPQHAAARQLGPQDPSRSQDAVMSPLRFRRLIQADTDDARLTAFRRAVALADRRLNVADVARSLLDWTPRQRQRWLYAYYDAPAPGDVPPDQQPMTDAKEKAA